MLDFVEVFPMRIVRALAYMPLLQSAAEHHRPTNLLSGGLQGTRYSFAVALLLWQYVVG